MLYGVILAGGKGERFWPLSRADKPKQFLRLTSDKMMLEETIDRILPLVPYERVRIVTGDSMVQYTLDNMPSAAKENILSEPCGRNTCLAIGLAAAHLLKEDEDAVMLVLSADHLIKPAETLCEILKAGASVAAVQDQLITIGIVPTRPETAYGYIKMGESYRQEGNYVLYNVGGFTEKPKAAVAHEYYYSHKYLWNSGMFVWSAKTILKAIDECQPILGRLLKEYSGHIGNKREAEARKELYDNAISISIDFAVLEHASNVLTIKGDIIWDDVGGWSALARYKDVDIDHNVIVGDAVALESFETTIYNNTDEIVTCLGVSDLVVVRTDDITLVVHKTMADEVKKILSKLEENEKTRKYL